MVWIAGAQLAAQNENFENCAKKITKNRFLNSLQKTLCYLILIIFLQYLAQDCRKLRKFANVYY